MRFYPIETLPRACPLFVEDAYENLVSELGVTAWHWHVPRTASELERFLLFSESRSRRSDFHELIHRDVFDHAFCFKGIAGAPFVLTMPYGDGESFHQAFKSFASGYYVDKTRVVYAADNLGAKSYSTQAWNAQLHCEPRMTAVIVPDRFKLRKNGDFAAVVAMDSWMRVLLEHRGFQLVSAYGGKS